MANPIDPDVSGVIGVITGIATLMGTIWAFIYRHLRKLGSLETSRIIERDLEKFETEKILPIWRKLEDRLTNVEKLEARLGAIQSDVGHLTDTMQSLHKSVERNAVDASNQLTGAMNRLSDQRKEDRLTQNEKFEGLKELLIAKMK